MQPLDRSRISTTSGSEFELPLLPDHNIDHLLATSRHLQRELSSRTMSSIADDSSVAESVSSVGVDGWEAVDRYTADDDSDYNEDAVNIATPIHDELTESALITPPEPAPEATQEEDTDASEAEQAAEIPQDQQACDVSLLWDSKQITFPEKTDASNVEKQQDVTCSVASIGGKTAQSFVEGSTWSDLENIAGSLRMKLAPQPLVMNRPLRLFYVGSDEFEDEIEAKIGSALVAGYGDNVPKRRRRSIMPISLSKESPEVQLNPDVGANMEIETCVDVQHDRTGNETLKVIMDNGSVYTSSWDREQSTYVVEHPETIPDIAIIHIPEDEDDDRTVRLRARQFLSRHSVPTILITSNRQWQAPARPLTIDVRSPHFIVHVPGTSISESAVLKRLPVDIDTFLQLNSLQLNRSLASMIDDAPVPASKLAKLDKGLLAEKTAKYLSLAVPVVYVLIILFASLIAPGSSPVTLSATPSAATTPASLSIAIPSASAVSSVSKSLSIPELKAVAQIPESAMRPNTSEKFAAEILGNNIVILKPPRWFTAHKRAPKLNFKVSRNGVDLEHEVSQLSDTKIFAISIPWELAYGPVEVRILSLNTRGVKVNETARVDFGSSVWKMLHWQNSPKEPVKDTPAEPEAKPASEEALARDRLVQDVEALGRELYRLGQSLRTTVVDRLISFGDERRRIYQERRQGRKEIAKSLSSRVSKVAADVRNFRRTHFREQQKDLLKLWWKLRGIPSDEAVARSRRSTHGKAKRATK